VVGDSHSAEPSVCSGAHQSAKEAYVEIGSKAWNNVPYGSLADVSRCMKESLLYP